MRFMAEVFYCSEIDWTRDNRIWVVRQRGQGVLQGETLDHREREEVGRNKNLSDESNNLLVSKP